MKKLLLSLLLTGSSLLALARDPHVRIVESLPGERWWGGFVALGNRMPFGEELAEQDLSKINYNNQSVPLLLSSEGRYVWSERPFRFRIEKGNLVVDSDYGAVEVVRAGENLRDAYAAASAAHFPPSGRIPQELFFSMPQYNTWIELTYDQNRHDIMQYARKVVEHGFPRGIFMIDDNWQNDYGNFDFKASRFPDPRGMIDSLHGMGFRVMLWIAPYVSPDSPEFRTLERKGYLLKNRAGKTAVIRWWNGFSACYDLTNPEAVAYLREQLEENRRATAPTDSSSTAAMSPTCRPRSMPTMTPRPMPTPTCSAGPSWAPRSTTTSCAPAGSSADSPSCSGSATRTTRGRRCSCSFPT